MKLKQSFTLIVVCCVLASCENSKGKNSTATGGDRVIKPTYAKGFEITYHGSAADIVLFNLEKEGDTLAVIHLARPIAGPLACMSTTHLAFLAELNLMDNVNGVCYADMIADSSIKKRVEDGKIINLTKGEILNTELLLAAAPAILYTYPFSDFQVPAHFKGAHIPVSEYLESHPLGRAEWIRLFGCLAGKQEMADSLFRISENDYQTTMSLLDSESASNKPSVFTGSFDGQMWFAPPANSFQAQLIEDAGGVYALDHVEGKSNIVLGDEEIIQNLQDADYWGELVFGPNFSCEQLNGYKDRYSGMKARIENHMFYCNTTEGEYFGAALLHPDLLLADLIELLHPGTIEGYQAKFFKLCSK